MKTDVILGIVILIIVVIVAAVLWTSSRPVLGGEQARFVATLTDAAANMGSVSQINVTIDGVRAHNNVQGWVTLSSIQQTYDLLELKLDGSQVVIADLNIPVSNYDQVELSISKVIVVDADGSHEAKLPSNKIRMNTDVNLTSGTIAVVKFDVLADESLHVTGNGLYILAPVIQLEAREDARISIDSRNRAIINGGEIKTNIVVGMDVNGNVGVGVRIPSNANINIGGDGKIIINPGVIGVNQNGRLVVGISDAVADLSTIQRIDVTINSVRVYSPINGWTELSTQIKTYDLLDLNASNTTVLLADANIPAGNYSQIELGVQKVLVNDANGTVEARVPSNRFKVITNTGVNANQTTVVRFDVLASESLHVTGNGQYIFAPVVNLETIENASVQLESNARVTVLGGIKRSIKIGMNENGEVGVNVRIPADLNIMIGNDNKIRVVVGGGIV